ncbi:hypothetical protein PRO82_000578 [Candidatus Protochlamydia amoebophila]|nr:hypothetical protein [Candidatus Protochlamydia amoebophila]
MYFQFNNFEKYLNKSFIMNFEHNEKIIKLEYTLKFL